MHLHTLCRLQCIHARFKREHISFNMQKRDFAPNREIEIQKICILTEETAKITAHIVI